jgi:hypothetical protein
VGRTIIILIGLKKDKIQKYLHYKKDLNLYFDDKGHIKSNRYNFVVYSLRLSVQ